jgi:hypothetical protein
MIKKLLATINTIIFVSVIAWPAFSLAQTTDTAAINSGLKNNADTAWAINNLVAPSSPGASLIGISPASIQRPTDPSAFSVSLLNATNNLTTIPNSYAVDFAPAWLFAGQHISFSDFQSDNISKNIWQSLDISVAYKNVKDSLTNNTNTTMGIAFKVSFFRGKINSKALKLVNQSYSLISNLLALQITERENYIKTHPEYLQMNRNMHTYSDSVKKIVQAKLQHIRDSLNSVVAEKSAMAKNTLDSVKKIGETIDFTRYGWKLDLAGGMSYYFPNQVYSNGTLNNAGFWLTGGYEDEDAHVSFLGIARYLYNAKEAYANPEDILSQNSLSTFDTGMRLLFNSKNNKFSFGGELIYRNILNASVTTSSYRYAINTDYEVGKNQIISFVFGRDFNGAINKSGNLLAALNFIIGFGNAKSIKQ